MHLLARSWTSNPIRSENTMFLDNAKAQFSGSFAGRGEIHASVVILRRKDRFAGFDKWLHLLSPPIIKGIFRDRKIEMVNQVSDLIGGILDPNSQSTLMRFLCQPQGIF